MTIDTTTPWRREGRRGAHGNFRSGRATTQLHCTVLGLELELDPGTLDRFEPCERLCGIGLLGLCQYGSTLYLDQWQAHGITARHWLVYMVTTWRKLIHVMYCTVINYGTVELALDPTTLDSPSMFSLIHALGHASASAAQGYADRPLYSTVQVEANNPRPDNCDDCVFFWIRE